MTTNQPSAQDHSVEVVIVDAASPLPPLLAQRADGTRWSEVWLFIRSEGAVAAIVEASYDGRDLIPEVEARGLVDAALSEAAVHPSRSVPDSDLPMASVVVCTDAKRPDHLLDCLAALVENDYPRVEIIVVDNHRGAEHDGVVPGIVAGLDGVRVVREAVPGLSHARNAGVRAARGEFIAFTDDDVHVEAGWLRAIGTRFALRPEEEIVTGLILPTNLETLPQLWFERHYGGFGGPRAFAPLTYRGAGSTAPTARRARVRVIDWHGSEVRRFAVYGAGVCGAGANMSYRTDTLRRLGGFDEALGAGTIAGSGEDLSLFIKHLWNGGAIGYEPAAVVSHSHRADYAALRKQLFNYGLGFTALMTALIIGDPRHLGGVASQMPAFVKATAGRMAARISSRPTPAVDALPKPTSEPPVPEELRWLEPSGALRGPLAYLRSLRIERRRSALSADRGPHRSR